MKTQKELIEYYKKQFDKVVKSHGADSDHAIHAFMLLRGAKIGHNTKTIFKYANKETERLIKQAINDPDVNLS